MESCSSTVNDITIIGKSNSIHIKNFIENVCLPNKYSFSLITYFNYSFSYFYHKNGCKMYVSSSNNVFAKIPKFRWLGHLLYIKKNISKINTKIFIVHYVDYYLMRLFSFIKFKRPFILVFWGSDLYRINRNKLKKMKYGIAYAKKIVVMTEDMKRVLSYNFGQAFDDKIIVSDFGNSVLDLIDLNREKKDFYQRSFFLNNLEGKRTIVTIGYNASRAQNHLKIIDSLSKIDIEEKNKVLLIVPLSYPKNCEKYIEKIEKKLKKTHFDYMLMRSFMDEDAISRLCLCTDIFINAQTTDALSFSMIEHIYSGNVVWNGNWLIYDFLNNNQIFNKRFSSFSELQTFLNNYQLDRAMVEKDLEKNKSIIHNYFSWQSCKKRWEKIIDDV